MTQRIEQPIDINVKGVGIENTIALLDKLDKKITKIKQNSTGLSRALASANKVTSGKSGVTKTLDNQSQKLKLVENQAGKTAKALSGITGYAAGIGVGDKFSMKTPSPAVSSATKTTSVIPNWQTNNAIAATAAYAKSATVLERVKASGARAKDKLTSLAGGFDVASNSAKKANFNFFRTRAILSLIFVAGAALVMGLKKWFDLASDYAEANHLYYSTLASSIEDVAAAEKTATLQAKDLFGGTTGQTLQVTDAIFQANNELERFISNMALDPTDVKRTYATFYEMANAAGMSTENVLKLSQGMTQLTYDMASLWDTDFSDSASAFQSGISGVATAVKKYGVDITRTAADNWLLANGYDATYRSLTRANKMIVMYNMLMEHTKTAQGDLARSALQPANMFRILAQQSKIAARQLGSAVFPVVTALIPIFIQLARAIQAAAASLAAFLGSKLGSWYTDAANAWSDYMNGLGGGGGIDLGGIVDELDDVEEGAGGATNALKELRDFQLGFDELHVLPDINIGGGGGGGGAGGIGDGIDIGAVDPYPFDTDLLSLFEEKAVEMFKTIRRAIDNAFGLGTVNTFFNTLHTMLNVTEKNIKKIWEASRGIRELIDDLWDWRDFLDGVARGYQIVQDAITNVIVYVLEKIPEILDWIEQIPILGPALREFFENFDTGAGMILGAYLALLPFIGIFKTLGKLASIALTPIKKIFGMFGGTKLLSSLGSLPALLGKIPGPVGWVITALAILAGAFTYTWQNSEEFREHVTNAVEKVQAKWDEFMTTMEPIFERLKEAFIKIGEAIGLDMSDFESLGEIIAFVVEGSLTNFVTLISEIAIFLIDVLHRAIIIVTGAIEMLATAFEGIRGVIDGVMSWFDGLGKFLTGVFTGDLELAEEGFNQMGDGISQVAESIYNTVKEQFTNIGDTVVEILGTLGLDVSKEWDLIKKFIDDPVRSIRYLTIEGFSWIKERTKSIFESMGLNSDRAWKEIERFIQNPVEYITKYVTRTWEGLKRSVSEIWSNIRDAIMRPIDQAWNHISGVVDRMKNIFNFQWQLPTIKLPHITPRMTTVAGVQIPTSWDVRWYAKGGIIDKPSLIGAGEAGPEAIVPLSGDKLRPFAEAVSKEMPSGGPSDNRNDDAFIAAIAAAVYNAVITGMPKVIKGDVIMDGKKTGEIISDSERKTGKSSGVATIII